LVLNIYETEKVLGEYLLFHYGTEQEILPQGRGPREGLDFPVRTAGWVLRHARERGSVLDLGCAVGRSSFELARGFKRVLGIDFSTAFIEAASAIAAGQRLAYWRVDEGELKTRLTAQMPSGVEAAGLTFRQGDACALPEDLGSFDAVLMANLLCRLPDPRSCLERSKSLVKTGGVLVLTTPGTWMKEFTPPEKWLGGYERDGKRWETLDGVREVLGDAFTLSEVGEEPFLIREHGRKFQWSSAQVSVWHRC
jgi:putative 4-mercaptohistidine N1-methyltranferase